LISNQAFSNILQASGVGHAVKFCLLERGADSGAGKKNDLVQLAIAGSASKLTCSRELFLITPDTKARLSNAALLRFSFFRGLPADVDF
jgi:hypothetical protein